MLAVLNIEWLIWTVETPPKSPSSQSRNGRIKGWWDKLPPKSTTKSWTTWKGREMTIKGRGEQHKGRSRGKKKRPKEE